MRLVRTEHAVTVVTLALALALALSVTAAAAAQDPAATAEPVHLDVVVTDAAGRPLSELRATDFELRDAGTLQVLEAVTFMGRQGDAAGEAAAGRRVFGILLDEFHVDAAATGRVREALVRFLDEEVRPGDQVVLLKPLDSLTGMRPTEDVGELRERVLAFEGRKGDYEPRTAFEEATMSRAPAVAAPERARVVITGVAALTHRLGALDGGRKSLVVVSDGVPDVPQRGRSRSVGLDAIVEAADRANVAIYTLAPAEPVTPDVPTGASSTPEDPARGMLAMLAVQTGGVYAAGQRMEEGLMLAARDLDGHYRLSYRAAHALDGRHVLDIAVARSGARVRARAAHWAIPAPAPLAEGAASDLARRIRRPQQLSRLIDTWFGVARGTDGRTQVTFTWEPRGRVQPAPDSLTFTAVGRNGDLLFEGRVDPLRAIGVGGVPTLSAIFEVPPGEVQIDMTIRNAGGATIDVDHRDIRVPDLHAGAILSTPAIVRTYSALQFRTLSADLQAPPAVSRRFSRFERLLVRVHAYPAGAPDGVRPEVVARLVGRGQEALREIRPLAGPPTGTLVQFDVPLSSLAPGEYGIEIQAGDRRELVLFEVTN